MNEKVKRTMLGIMMFLLCIQMFLPVPVQAAEYEETAMQEGTAESIGPAIIPKNGETGYLVETEETINGTADGETPDPDEEGMERTLESSEDNVPQVMMEEEESVITEEMLTETVVGSEEGDVEEISVTASEEEQVGGNAYTMKLQWRDGGTKTVPLTNSTTEGAVNQAKSLLSSVHLDNRYYITVQGDTIRVTMLPTSPIKGKPTVVAHMGYCAYAPENTLSSIRMAAQFGYTDVEFDVRFTKDGIPVLSHDGTLTRYGRNLDGTEIKPNVNLKDLNYADLSKYDFGIRRGQFWKGEAMPTLESALETCKRLNLRPYLDIKWESRVTKDMLGTIYQLVEKSGLHGKVCYLSNDPGHLKYFAERDPDSMYTLIVFNLESDYIGNAEKLKKMINTRMYLYFHLKDLTEGIMRTCRFHSLRVNTAVSKTAQIAGLDKWIDSISTTGILPNKVRSEAAKRSPYAVTSCSGAVKTGKDYIIYPSGNCGLCIHMTSSRVGRPVVTGDGSGIAEMNDFRMNKVGDNRYQLLSTRCMFALAPDGEGRIVLKAPDTNDLTTQWEIQENTDRTYTFINAETGKTLQADCNNMQQLYTGTPNGKASEKFYLALAPEQVTVKFTGTRYSIQPSKSSSYAVGIKNGSLNENANAHLTKYNHDFRAQHFTFIYSGDGYYRIMNEYSGKCLTMKDGKAVQQSWNNQTAQRWKIVWQGNDLYTIQSKVGGNMHIKGAVAQGTLIDKATSFNGDPKQKWYIRLDV